MQKYFKYTKYYTISYTYIHPLLALVSQSTPDRQPRQHPAHTLQKASGRTRKNICHPPRTATVYTKK